MLTIGSTWLGGWTWLSWHSRRFRDFLSNDPPDLVIEHRPSPGEPRYHRTDSTDRIVVEGTSHPRILDVMLTELLPGLLAPSLVVHAALLGDGERSFLCCGHSGAGKSTLAALLPEWSLCDELAAVRLTGSGFHGVSLPYWTSRPGSAPLAGVFILEHAPAHRRSRLEPADAVRELRHHVCWPTEEAEALAGSFRTLTRLTETVPVYRLAFRRDPGVWNLITEPPA